MRKRQEEAHKEAGRELEEGAKKAATSKEEVIKELFKDANSTLTFSPITEEDWKAQSAKLVEEEGIEQSEADKLAARMMIEEFLDQEMGIRSDQLQEVMGQVKDFFPKTKTGWKTLVVSFQTESIVEWILKGNNKMRMGVVGEDKPVVENWVPSGMYRRFNAVKSIAWRQRHKTD